MIEEFPLICGSCGTRHSPEEACPPRKQTLAPQPDEGMLLSDEEIQEADYQGRKKYRQSLSYAARPDLKQERLSGLKAVAHAQAIRCNAQKEKEIVEIWTALEAYRFGEPQDIPQSGREPVVICLTETDLQVLKKGETK